MSNVLIIFPCAGGSSENFARYRQYEEELGAKVICMEYSGHWSRYKEALYEDFTSLLEDMTTGILQLVDEKDHLYLMGHSMGGYVAYEIAMILQKREYCVKCLFLAACMPMLLWDGIRINIQGEEDIYNFLRKIRQVPEKVLYSDFFRENFLPAIRNDLRILVDYSRRDSEVAKTSADIICFHGMEDPLVDSMEVWNRYTLGDFRVEYYEGEHFFLHQEKSREKMLKQISEVIRAKENSKL